MAIDAILQSFSHFGVRLGLDSIQQLLKNLGNPHEQVPIIHVAGSNGKGSVCAYLSTILTEAGYTVGRYTSPHLIDWTERICLNNQAIAPETLESILQQVVAAIQPDDLPPTQFEVITAAAWLYFAQQEVDVAVMEVGLGGRLDATNVCDYPLVSIITSISREHWQRLGPTLADIAWEKAGILKPGCSAVIGQMPPEAASMIHRRATELGCVANYAQPAQDLGNGWAEYRGVEEYEIEASSGNPEERSIAHLLKTIRYPLSLQGAIQLHNSAIAIATLQLLREQGWQISDEEIANGIAKTQWAGRLQWFTWQGDKILIDGAHNPASAKVLREFVDTLNPARANIHWVMGMLSTKDHEDVFQELLRSRDSLYLVPVPDHSTAEPAELAVLAKNICPNLAQCHTFSDVVEALKTATHQAGNQDLVVLCGSLYLLGHFLKTANPV
ncbi:bifunctional folylpolyglutamate synthase/dihydrofolate synthase [Phormidium sp. CLA17]|uniref:bifunctional folylpolyglutamate synthase/dihydrofolate synthase n=1 Tax=Leptolyngbya sp. Cla-17 TaxID=2803751 RepID=UPI001492E18A|nr:folylpolyglutamate synthase/dihydrofolate synthase family protein [Leptolyngbya sp. Cla-17]MBM0741918.1 bifunctional folylpolyglutamate synthase/dihydrofolate synthase [Leptolyngbya sp. Cla-17]